MTPASNPGGKSAGRLILREVLLVSVTGLAVALLGNQLSPRGLSLTRNYFPSTAAAPALVRDVAVTTTNQSAAEKLAVEVKSAGLQLASRAQIGAWFADPRRLAGKIIFVDARNETDYFKGHIPGAWLFDPYQPEKYFPTVVPACQNAEEIVVYCHGGDCDDSLSAATLLKQVGIPGDKLHVYGGGMGEWQTTAQPVETGPQNSGQIKPVVP